jgi:hypothetical protein
MKLLKHPKRILLVLFMLIGVTHLFAYDFEVDGIYYNYNSANKSCSVTYKTSSHNTYSGDIEIPNNVIYNGKTIPVTAIGEYAFCDSNGLISVVIPNSITTIEDYAFYGCSDCA